MGGGQSWQRRAVTHTITIGRTGGAVSVSHQPIRPTWQCAACREPWPCASRQARFLDDFQGRKSILRMTLGLWFIDAMEDRPDAVQELRTQFFDWLSKRRR